MSIPQSERRASIATRIVRGGIESDRQFGAIMPPIYMSSNYSFAGLGQKREYDYSRSGNPTRDVYASALAEAEQGARAVVCATGMASIALFCQLLGPDDLVIAPHDCYGGSYRLLTALERRGAFRLQYIDYTDPDALRAAADARPAWFWVETPSNPLLRLTDIEAVVAQARRVGARVAVDNTFSSPVLQRPLTLGADLVAHSTTKYINGHSDVVGGALIAREEELGEEIAWWANCLGIVGAPFDAFLSLRGMRTLPLRMRAHEENASAIAHLLAASSEVSAVHWPGLETHADHELAKRQQDGFGAMLSIEVRGGYDAVHAFVDGLRYFSLAESLGGVESLVAHPATMTHAAMDEEARIRAGITQGLLRLSVGLEDIEDLLADLRAALERVRARAGAGQGDETVSEPAETRSSAILEPRAPSSGRSGVA